MKSSLYLILNIFLACIKLIGPNGQSKLIAENFALRQQLISSTRHMKRAPNLTTTDRIIFGFLLFFIRPKRLTKIAIVIK